MGGYATIAYEIDDGLLRLTLDRPARMNAYTTDMAMELVDAYRRASADDAVRAVVVSGAGRSFCAGMDLTVGGNVFGLDEMLGPTNADLAARPVAPEIEQGVRDTGGKVALAMFECLKPIVGAINGAAVGIGATMTLPMDFRLGSTDTRIGFVFGRIGITPEACSTWFLPRIVGLQKALALFYRADILDAQEALDMGLLWSLHSPETLVDEACRFAHALVADRSPVSIALIRQMTYRNSAKAHPRMAHDVESLGVFHTSIADGKEGVAAFLEKRTPHFESHASAMPPFYPWEED